MHLPSSWSEHSGATKKEKKKFGVTGNNTFIKGSFLFANFRSLDHDKGPNK
jgi:hypothetical protein